jgi:hypothetical protein
MGKKCKEREGNSRELHDYEMLQTKGAPKSALKGTGRVK